MDETILLLVLFYGYLRMVMNFFNKYFTTDYTRCDQKVLSLIHFKALNKTKSLFSLSFYLIESHLESKMEKVELRAVIKYLCKKGMTPMEIHEDFMKTLENESPSYSKVKKWAAECKRGGESIEDDARSGRPKDATTDENVEIVHNLVMCERG